MATTVIENIDDGANVIREYCTITTIASRDVMCYAVRTQIPLIHQFPAQRDIKKDPYA